MNADSISALVADDDVASSEIATRLPIRAEGLDAELKGPAALLPDGRKCAIHFEADATVTIRLGTRDYGQGYASPYLASILAARLGIPLDRVRLYYMGTLPAAKVTPKRVLFVPSRSSVGPTVGAIGDLIALLCDHAIEKGRCFLASAMNVRRSDIEFDAASGRFSVLGADGYSGILDIAVQARGAIEAYAPSCSRSCLTRGRSRSATSPLHPV